MREPVSFFVKGKPQPAGSKRAFVIKKAGAYTGRAIVTDANPKARDWKIDVQHEAQCWVSEPWNCPIRLSLTFTMQRPKSHYRTGQNSHLQKQSAPLYPASKPDATKLCRGVEDAMTGIAWVDDAQIVTQHVRKRYGGQQGVLVEIYEETP